MTFSRLRRLTWAIQADGEFRTLGWSRGTFLRKYYRGRLRDHQANRHEPLVDRVDVRHGITGGAASLEMRLGPAGGDWLVLRGVWLHQDYYHPSFASCRTILDLGANVGMAAVWLHGLTTGAQLACVEPDPRNQPLLRRNLEANGVNAAVFPCAVSTRRGRARLMMGLDTGWSSLEHVGLHPHEDGVDVETRRVTDFLDEMGWAGCDLLKLDVEGLERELFADAADWLPRVGRIVFELHENTSEQEIGALLAPHGWRLTRLGHEVEATYLATPEGA